MKLRIKNLCWSVVALLLISCGGVTSTGKDVSSARPIKPDVKSKLNHIVAPLGDQVTDIRFLQELNLYEVVLDKKEIVYVDETLHHIILGEVLNLDSKKNLTEERLANFSKVDFQSLPLEKSFVTVRGNGENKIAIFTDPDCPYCKQLEKQLDSINDITVYNFLMPLESLHKDAKRKAIQIWCQPEDKRGEVWHRFMVEGKSIPKVATCSNPVEDNIKFGASESFNGTPTIIFSNGRVLMGLSPKEKMIQLIKENSK